MHFIDQKNVESYHTITDHPKILEKKVIILKYFRCELINSRFLI